MKLGSQGIVCAEPFVMVERLARILRNASRLVKVRRRHAKQREARERHGSVLEG